MAGTRFYFVLLLMCIGLGGSLAESPTGTDQLSTDESIALLYFRSDLGGSVSACRLADPQIKPLLYELLNGPMTTPPQVQANAAFVLGFIGNSSDVPKIREYLRKHFKSPPSAEEYYTIGKLIKAVSALSWRKVDGARGLLSELATPEFWADVPLHKTGGIYSDAALGAVHTLVREVLFEIEFNDGTGREAAEAYVARAQNVVDRDKLKRRFSEDVVAYGSRLRKVQRDAWTQPPRLDERFCNELREFTQRRGAVIRAATKPSLPTTAATSLGEKSGLGLVSGNDLWKDAWASFAQIQKALMAGQVETVLDRVANNGAVLGQRVRQRKAEKLAKDLEFEKQLFQEIGDIEIRDAAVTLHSGKSIDLPRPEATSDLRVAWDEVASVSFRLTANPKGEIGNRLLNLRGSLTIAGDGSLVIVMIRTDNRWYWNPFGW